MFTSLHHQWNTTPVWRSWQLEKSAMSVLSRQLWRGWTRDVVLRNWLWLRTWGVSVFAISFIVHIHTYIHKAHYPCIYECHLHKYRVTISLTSYAVIDSALVPPICAVMGTGTLNTLGIVRLSKPSQIVQVLEKLPHCTHLSELELWLYQSQKVRHDGQVLFAACGVGFLKSL